jgi:hypothetical protein
MYIYIHQNGKKCASIKLHVFYTQVIYFVTTLITILNHCRYKRGAVKPATLCVQILFFFCFIMIFCFK